jgi:hypothetical protein
VSSNPEEKLPETTPSCRRSCGRSLCFYDNLENKALVAVPAVTATSTATSEVLGNTVGSTINTSGSAAGGATSAVGRSLGRIQISESADASASGGSVLSLRGENLRVEKGTTFILVMTQAASGGTSQ